MKNKILKDSWFQMFAAVGGVVCVVYALGTTSTRHDPLPASAPAAASAPSAERVPGTLEPIRPITTPHPAAAVPPIFAPSAQAQSAGPAAAPPPAPPPQMTLTGTGIGNTQGIVGGAAGGGGVLSGFLSGLMGVTPRQAAPAVAAFNRIAPAQSGVFSVGKIGLTGADTDSLRDAVFSAANGDLILVKPGTYEGPIEVSGKTVRIRGAGANPGDVIVRWTGPGATLVARYGSVDLENLRVTRGSFFDSPRVGPGGAVYAVAAIVSMRKVELRSDDSDSPPLIVEKGDTPTRVTVADSVLTGSRANTIVRGPVSVKFTRVLFEPNMLVGAAWLDAVIELADCRFGGGAKENLFNAYEGARVILKGEQKPRINGVRGSDATSIEESFGGARVANARSGFARDIFRRGRRPGTLP